MKTSAVDHADWNYRPLLGFVQRRRFRLCLGLLGAQTYRNLLVVGYGSGVFLPELRRRTVRLFGIDIHRHDKPVSEVLQSLGVSADLTSGSAEQLPYPADCFDAIVAVSSLEFVEDIESAAADLARVLTYSGKLVVVMPASSPFLDFLLRLFTGADAQADYGDRRPKVIPALIKHFTVERMLVFPRLLAGLTPIYRAFAFHRRK